MVPDGSDLFVLLFITAKRVSVCVALQQNPLLLVSTPGGHEAVTTVAQQHEAIASKPSDCESFPTDAVRRQVRFSVVFYSNL